MGENESTVTWKHVLSCLVAAAFIFDGVIKSWNKPNVTAWEEMAKTLLYLGGRFLVFLIILVVGFTIFFVTNAILDKCEALYLMWKTNRNWRDDRELDLKESNRLKEKVINQNSEIINRLIWVEINQKSQGEEIKGLKDSPRVIQAVNLQQVENDLLGRKN
jgi:hypothetical protein